MRLLHQISLLFCFICFISSIVAARVPANYPNAAPMPRSLVDKTGQAHYLDAPVESLRRYLGDPKQRIHSMFRIPEAIEHDVFFWFLIYTKYSLFQTLIYDKDHHQVMYDVVNNQDLFDRGKSAVAIELETRRRVHQKVAQYKNALAALSRNPTKHYSESSLESKILKQWAYVGRSKLRSRAHWQEALKNLRTQAGQRDRILQGISDAQPFMPSMEIIFERSNLPPELTRISLVESSFNLRAYSKANAVGVWQFLERSARGDKLIVNRDQGLDERLSPIKSTYAAARMFVRNYKILGDYALATIAYNHGPRNLLKIKNKFKGDNITKLLNMKTGSPLGYASRNYYSEFLALLHAEKYRDEIYNIPLHSALIPPAVSLIKLKRPMSVFELSAQFNISVHELKIFNPDIFNLNKKLPMGTRVVLPRKIDESLASVEHVDSFHARIPAQSE